MSSLATMPRYDDCLDSQIVSLGMIPKHWKIVRFRNLFTFGKGLTITKENLEDTGIPCVSYGEVHSKYGFEVNPKKHDLKCVNESYLKSSPSSLLADGDFVFADTSEDIEGAGNFTHVSGRYTLFAGYHTVIARPRKGTNSRFIAYTCDSLAYRMQVRKKVKGVKVFSITQGILKDTFLWLPDKGEQIAIAAYLDAKTTHIDQAIATKQKQIELLKERRQILIQNAVTRGLDPQALIRPSGVEWIGEIPAHWKLLRLKYIFQETTLRTQTGTETLLSLRMEQGLVPHKDVSDKHIPEENLIDYKIVYPGQLVMNRMRAAIGIFGVASAHGLVSPDYAVFNIRDGANSDYFLKLFKTTLMGTQFRLNSKGMGTGSSGFMRLYTENFGNIAVPFPPAQEQAQIISYIEKESAKIDKAIALQQQQIASLKEYRATLINSAVTGKIKVV